MPVDAGAGGKAAPGRISAPAGASVMLLTMIVVGRASGMPNTNGGMMPHLTAHCAHAHTPYNRA